MVTVAVVGPCTDLLLALVTVGVSSGLLGSMVVLFIVNCVPHVRDGSELCKQLEIASRVGVAHQAKLSSIQVESASIWRWSNNFCRSHNHRSNWTQSRYKPDSLLRLPAPLRVERLRAWWTPYSSSSGTWLSLPLIPSRNLTICTLFDHHNVLSWSPWFFIDSQLFEYMHLLYYTIVWQHNGGSNFQVWLEAQNLYFKLIDPLVLTETMLQSYDVVLDRLVFLFCECLQHVSIQIHKCLLNCIGIGIRRNAEFQ